jgi:hypothetical protein
MRLMSPSGTFRTSRDVRSESALGQSRSLTYGPSGHLSDPKPDIDWPLDKCARSYTGPYNVIL